MKAKRMLVDENKNSIIKIILISITMLLVISIIFFVIMFYKKNNAPILEELVKDKEVLNMKIKDVKIEENDGIYTFRAKIVNTTNQKFEKQKVQIIFKDEINQKIYKYPYVILDLEKREYQEIEIKTSKNLKEFKNFDIKIQK